MLEKIKVNAQTHRLLLTATGLAAVCAFGYIAAGKAATDATHQDNLADVNGGDQSVTNGNEKYVVRRVGSDRYIDVFYSNRHLFTVEDRKESDPDGSDTKAKPDAPALIDDYDHDFYLSPDHRYLFIEQKLMHCYDVTTLYGPLNGSHYGMIKVKGRQFDEAAGQAFCKINHVKLPYDNGTRVTHFVKWTKTGVDFTVGAANFYCGDGPEDPGNIEYDWSGHYDLKTKRFTHVHIDDTNTHAKWLKEKPKN